MQEAKIILKEYLFSYEPEPQEQIVSERSFPLALQHFHQTTKCFQGSYASSQFLAVHKRRV